MQAPLSTWTLTPTPLLVLPHPHTLNPLNPDRTDHPLPATTVGLTSPAHPSDFHTVTPPPPKTLTSLLAALRY